MHIETDLQLAGVDSLMRHSGIEAVELFVIQAHIDPAGVGLRAAFACAHRQPQRFVCELGLEVPESDIYRADGGVHLAFITALEYEIDHALPQTDYRSWVLAFDQVE